MADLTKTKNPWWWVPTLYFAEGIPYFVVNNISVMMFTKMGVPNGDMSFFTTLLYFPWFLKGVWSPIVDVVKTKRWWIVVMQILIERGHQRIDIGAKSVVFRLKPVEIPLPSVYEIGFHYSCKFHRGQHISRIGVLHGVGERQERVIGYRIA